MISNEKWMFDYQVPLFEKYDKLEKLLNSGIVYGFQRDSQNRPIMYYSIRRSLDLDV